MLTAGGTPPALAADPCTDGCVTLSVSGTSGPSFTRTFSIATILGVSDRGRTDYTVRRGGEDDVYTAPGAGQTTSVRRVLVRLLHVAPGPDTALTVTRPSGGSFTLAGADLDEPGSPDYPFADGPPVLTSLGKDGQITFIRPQRDSGDENGSDFLVARRLSGSVTTGSRILAPTVSAEPATTTPGKAVALTATDGGATGSVSYSWDFGDGTPEAVLASSTSHEWSSTSTYDVTVTVQGDNGTGVATVSVRVEGAASPGPGDGGGGGAADGPRTGGPGSGNQSGAGPGKGGDGSGGPGTKGTGTKGTSGAATSGTTGGPTQGSTAAAQARRALEQARAQRDGRSTPRAGTTGGRQVSGVLLDAEASSAVTAPSGSSPRVASATTRPATEIPADRRWLLAGVPLLLLLLGGARQTRWLTRRLPELPWRTS